VYTTITTRTKRRSFHFELLSRGRSLGGGRRPQPHHHRGRPPLAHKTLKRAAVLSLYILRHAAIRRRSNFYFTPRKRLLKSPTHTHMVQGIKYTSIIIIVDCKSLSSKVVYCCREKKAFTFTTGRKYTSSSSTFVVHVLPVMR
jgi:hypothetical protein